MAVNIQQRGTKFQLRVQHKLLPKDYFHTADTRAEAEGVRDRLLSWLAQGVVPQALLAPEAKAKDDVLVLEMIGGYEKSTTVTPSDLDLLKLMRAETAGLRHSGLSYEWVEGWVKRMKLTDNRAPGTIRKYVGCLARVVDWHHKKVTPHGQVMPANPLRLLPRGYSQYTDGEARVLELQDKAAKVDEQRDRRLAPDEEARVRAALAGEKRSDRERPLPVDPQFTLAFEVILGTGIRLSEMFKMRVEHVLPEQGWLRLEGSKATRGKRKPRVVPLHPHLRPLLAEQIKGRKGRDLVFDFWDMAEAAKKCSARLSGRFLTLFKYADVSDFSEHDLRHEATCRWFLLRRPDGAWVFSEIEICRIMGWTSTKMALRYASLRGEDLADRLL